MLGDLSFVNDVQIIRVFHRTQPMGDNHRRSVAAEKFQRLLDQLVSSGTNRRLRLLGVLMTMFDARTRLSRQVVDEVRRHFGGLVFDTIIPRTTRLAEAPSHGRPIIYYDRYSAGAAAYEVLAQEVLGRLAP